MESLKLNYIMYGTARTGGTRTLLNFMNELVKLGHEVSITTMFYDKWFPLSNDVRIITPKSKIDLFYVYGMQFLHKNNQIAKDFAFLNKLMSIVPKVDINVATFSPTAYIASWKSTDGSTPFYHMQHLETIMTNDLIRKKFISDTYFLPIYKVANSIWLRDQLVELTGKKHSIVNPAVEHNIFYRRPKEKENLKDIEDVINIVALGKGGWKNALGIYQAVNDVRKIISKKKIILHYFGHSPPSTIAFDNKLTIFHKDLTDDQLANLYSNSDIQITFSTAESFPLPSLESMACGCSVITTQFGTEDYAVDGENAIIVEPGNLEMLTNKIKTLIENEQLRTKLIENGMKTASLYNYSRQTKILETEFKKALEENGKINT